ncbi:GlxA family transcriptional regulator [Gemmobacter denitrificans]|uniref:Helix-turn-helix domain-containing protein n=1 Tax=Gemmobacter denitrificans TaxID=3123040 RepID=A0ABU8C088_9RHOB
MRIAIIAYDGISPFMLSTPLAVFDEACPAHDHNVIVCAHGGRISAKHALGMTTGHNLQDAQTADLIILPGWRNADEPVLTAIVEVLGAAHARGAIVAGLCLGAYGLAEAGLLNGRRATTHWARIGDFGTRYPKVQTDPTAIFVDEGQILTSAGNAAALDCCLHLLARFSGMSAANSAARYLVVAPHRSGGQPQLTKRPVPAAGAETKVAEILNALWADPTGNPSLDELAARCGVSRRTLTRHIRARTGGNLSDLLRHARIARAQDALLGAAQGIDRIAAHSGFPDPQSMRAAFRQELGMTPTQWRARQRLG